MTCTFFINATLTIFLGIIPALIVDESISYIVELILTFLFGSSVAILQTALYGTAGPSKALTSSLMIGIGLSSLLMNLLRMLFLVLIPDYETGAIIFFSLTGVYLGVCAFLSYDFLKRYSKFYDKLSSTDD